MPPTNPTNPMTPGNPTIPAPEQRADPLGLGELAAPAKRKMNSQVLTLALVVGISGATLMAMRAYGMRSGLKFQDLPSDYAQSIDPVEAKEYERIMADLARINKPLDVALDDMGRSPFMLRMTKSRSAVATTAHALPASPDEPPEAREARARATQKAELMNRLAKMELHSVMGGKRPIARINDETLTVGQKIDGFTLVQVDGRSVTLEADGWRFTLTMQTAADKASKPKK